MRQQGAGKAGLWLPSPSEMEVHGNPAFSDTSLIIQRPPPRKGDQVGWPLGVSGLEGLWGMAILPCIPLPLPFPFGFTPEKSILMFYDPG